VQQLGAGEQHVAVGAQQVGAGAEQHAAAGAAQHVDAVQQLAGAEQSAWAVQGVAAQPVLQHFCLQHLTLWHFCLQHLPACASEALNAKLKTATTTVARNRNFRDIAFSPSS
jgi:hypothetical protein